MNVALKVAIVQSRKTAKAVAQRTRIGEVRLSSIVHGRTAPSDEEMKALARILKVRVDEIFPETEMVAG